MVLKIWSPVTEQYQQYPTEPHPAGRILGRSLSERPTPNLDRCQAIRDEEVPPDWLIDRMWSCDIKTETSADTPEETNKRHRNVRAFTITLRINLSIAPINVFFVSNQWVNSYALISVICFVGSPPVPGTQKRIWIIWLMCFCVCDVGPDGFHISFLLIRTRILVLFLCKLGGFLCFNYNYLLTIDTYKKVIGLR